MQLEIHELAEFDGARPMGTRLSLPGIIPQRTNDLHEGEEVILIVRAKVGKVAFATDAKKVRSRVHTANVEEGYVIPDGDNHSAADWLSDIRIAHKKALDAHAATQPDGQQVIDDPDDAELKKLEAELEAEEAAAAKEAEDQERADEVANTGHPEGMSDEEWEASASNPNHVVEPAGEEVTAPRAAAKLGKGKASAR